MSATVISSTFCLYILQAGFLNHMCTLLHHADIATSSGG